MKKSTFLCLMVPLAGLLFAGCSTGENNENPEISLNPGIVLKPALPFNPRHYICYRGDSISVDGLLNEPSWESAEWSSDFTDIEGTLKPEPLYRTRVKMLWDANFLYVGAEISEPHIWAYLKQRDTVIFYDNDFEIFIDPDGDTHGYYEYEMNAAGTVWDLLLTMPYRDGGRVIDAWNINGLKTGVAISGTLNNPGDIDKGWTVELAIPFDVLKEWGETPADSSLWRINFSRVNWQTEIADGRYVKKRDPQSGKLLPEYNWVWSPQGIINMHYPEMWGYLQFSTIVAGEGKAQFIGDPDSLVKWSLRTLYYSQRVFASKHGYYSDNINELENLGYESTKPDPSILLTNQGYQATLKSEVTGKTWMIDHKGQITSLGQ